MRYPINWPIVDGGSIERTLSLSMSMSMSMSRKAGGRGGARTVRKHQIFRLCVENARADARRDGRTCLSRPNSLAITGTGGGGGASSLFS